MIEVELDDRLICIHKTSLCKLQAVWRGTLARRRLAGLQHDYLQLVKDLEKNDNLQVAWKYGPLCLPTLTSKKKLKAAEESAKRSKQETADQSVAFKESERGICDKTYERERTPQHSQDSHKWGEATEDTLQASREPGAEVPENLAELSRECTNSIKESDDLKDLTKTNHSSEKNKVDSKLIQEPSNDDNTRETNFREEDHMNRKNGDDNGDGDDEFIKMLNDKKYEVTEEELESARGHIAMELLWVQQAITSRKQYLRLRDQMVQSVPESYH